MGARVRQLSCGGRLLALLVGVCLIGVHPHHASASAPMVPARRVNVESPATMLELDSDDAVLARRLGQALRRAFALRGLDDGRRDSLAELRLAMGCSDDEPECLARGGRTLGAKTLTYGSVQTTNAGHVLDMTMLAVDTAKVTSSVRLTLSAADVGESALDRTAERVVAVLLDEGVVPAPVEPPPVPPPVLPKAASSSAPPPVEAAPRAADRKGKGKLKWGFERPTPTWKWALFGTGVGLTVVSTAALIGTSVGTQKKEDDLRDAANASLVDDSPMNDVDPRVVPDICAAGREHPQEDTMNPDSVRNKDVVEVCNQADALQKGVIASWALLGVSLAATFVFTGLLFLHRDKRPGASATARRFRASFSPGPRGVAGAISGRF